jgi:oxygen-dependent protoporphyrinogen oxidase
MNEISNKEVVILGGGISGLTTAYWLKKANIDLLLLEKNAEVGGSMESARAEGYLFDKGSNSGLETSHLIRQLVDELKLTDEYFYANPESKKRYILRDGKLHPLPMDIKSFIATKLFSLPAKLKLLFEPFHFRSKDGYNQSVAEFVTRRLGREFLDYAINPFVSGVYAGDPEKLSVHSAFPKLYELEKKYGGLILGTIRSMKERRERKDQSKQNAQMFSFLHGMQTLPKSIAVRLDERVQPLCDVLSVTKDSDYYLVTYNKAGDYKVTVRTKAVLSTLPAYSASKVFDSMLQGAKEHFDDIYYPPVMIVLAGFRPEAIGQKLDGFGFLIPSKENRSFLGAIWSSSLFPSRAPIGTAAFSLFIGGAQKAEMFEQPKEKIINQALQEFKEIMQISEEPIHLESRFWSRSIPQYNLGYIEHERFFEECEKNNPGLFLGGNYRGGIAVGDCIKNSEPIANKILEYLRK